MLKRQNRITENREFLKIFKTVRPVHTEHLAFRVAKRQLTHKSTNNGTKLQNYESNNQSTVARASRFGFVVSNKIDKRSARRNGLKRRIRAVIELKLPEIKQTVDVVIQVKKAFDYPYNFRYIEQEVLEGLKKSGLLK